MRFENNRFILPITNNVYEYNIAASGYWWKERTRKQSQKQQLLLLQMDYSGNKY
jgi:hypothetical protein